MAIPYIVLCDLCDQQIQQTKMASGIGFVLAAKDMKYNGEEIVVCTPCCTQLDKAVEKFKQAWLESKRNPVPS